MPVDLRLGLLAVEFCARKRPELGEIEFIVLALVPQLSEQLTVERIAEHLGPAAADVEHAVFQSPACFAADKVAGREPDPGRGEIAAPVFVRIAVARLRCDAIALAVEGDGAGKGGLHALGVPEHLKGVEIAEEAAGAVADVEGDLFVDLEIPAHLPGVAHPFRMGRSLLRRDADMAGGVRLAACAVGGGNGIGRVFVHRHVLPGEEAVELAVVLAPEADVDHQIGRQSPLLFRLALVPDNDGLVRGLFGIAGKEFHIKGLLLAGALVYGRKGVPPPVIALFCQRSAKHPLISRDIALV